MPQAATQGTPKKIEFEGSIHEFPADFSDADIQSALASLPHKALPMNYRTVDPGSRTPQKDDQGVIKGFVDRIAGTARGVRSMVMPSEAEDVQNVQAHLPARIGETYKEGARQTKEQFQQGLAAAKEGNVGPSVREFGRAAVTGASLLDPFATSSVVDANRAADEGRLKEAIGAGAFDVLNLWAGSKIGHTPNTAQKISKLTSAVGETGETVRNLERTLPEIEQTARQAGKPGTIGAFADNVRTSLTRLQTEFNNVFDPIKHNRAYTPAIKNHIDRIVRENPNLTKTPEGRAQLASLRRIQRIYDKPWTLEDMNLERSRLRKEMRALYDAKPTDAAAKTKLDAELRAKKVVADSFSETVNDHLAQQTGKPQSYYDILRQKQEAFLDLNDHLDTQVEKLRDKQAAREGRTISERIRPHAYASAGGPRVHVPFGEAVPGEGASDVASRKVRQAFGPSKKGRVARAAVLSLPISHLATAGEDAKKSRMAPPPSMDE
jgi:hypothetical protein